VRLCFSHAQRQRIRSVPNSFGLAFRKR